MLPVLLSVLTILLVSLGVFVLSKRTKFPYTVLLVVFGILLIPVSRIEPFTYLQSFVLSPDLLFFLILPTLIFESAYNMDGRKMLESIRSITILSVLSLLISTVAIALGLHYGARIFGYELPLSMTLLFGALISATDPVAVLALFKEYGAPKRLSLIFEGESLFNDGTSLALFLVILEILMTGWGGVGSVLDGIFMFTTMVVGGIIFGGLMGALFSKIIERVRGNEYLEITLTMIVAHFTFIFSELISHSLLLFGHEIKFSSIIATVIAAMVVGNYGRYKISPRVEEYMEKFWGYFAFLANSIVFMLIGLLFASLDIPIRELAVPVTLAVVVVMVARAISVYPIIGFLNWTKKEEQIPMTWQHLLAWGSLRGALAVTMVLLIPEDITVSGWAYTDISVRDYITAFTIACIYFTLFIKATTIGPMIKKLKIDQLSPIEEVEREEGRALVYAKVLLELDRFLRKGYITPVLYKQLRGKYESLYREACETCKNAARLMPGVAEKIVTIYAAGVERASLKTLFFYEEVNETVYKKALHDLNLRVERAERVEEERVEIRAAYFEKDWLDLLAEFGAKFFLGIFRRPPEAVTLYMYYRARTIMANKVIEELTALSESDVDLFENADIFMPIIERYRRMSIWAKEKHEEIHRKEPKLIDDLTMRFAEAGLFKAEEKILEDLLEKEAVSSKVQILLTEELIVRTGKAAAIKI
jgi:CPA1 family monovalent cation:H+ antiporter